MSRKQQRYPLYSSPLHSAIVSTTSSRSTPSSYRSYAPYGSTPLYGNYGSYTDTLRSLNLMSPALKNLDKRIGASQKSFKLKELLKWGARGPVSSALTPHPAPPASAASTASNPPARPERRARSSLGRSRSFNADRVKSISLTSLDSVGYCSGEGEGEASEAEEGPRDYRALWLASQAEVRRLRDQLATTEAKLTEANATLATMSHCNQTSMSEAEKREKRAMERKLSEMEEELKLQSALQAENQRLKDENGALIRVISKLSK